MVWLVLIVMKLEDKGFFFPPYYFIIIHKHVYIKTHFITEFNKNVQTGSAWRTVSSYRYKSLIVSVLPTLTRDAGIRSEGELTFDPCQKKADGLWWFSSQCIGWSRTPCDGMCDTMVQRWCIDSCATTACTCRMLLKSFGTQTETSLQGP